ncbi:hypothetical protein LTR72_011635 [Exophiala xenobiotica]|nr:hypothetical protein LTR72_011635 [Exophiala xenobiotica]KAK5332680.1 hypothetical protein LTR98_011210 [Exophiala xenobiotica]KAK5356247.1 hypothetical protein LTR11_011599 [Exophiala xenobiotica]
MAPAKPVANSPVVQFGGNVARRAASSTRYHRHVPTLSAQQVETVVQNPLRRIERFTEKLGTRISVATGLGKAAAAAETAAIENAANRATEARLKNVIENIGPTGGDGAVMAAEVNIPGYREPVVRARIGKSTPDPPRQDGVLHLPAPKRGPLLTSRILNDPAQHSGSTCLRS